MQYAQLLSIEQQKGAIQLLQKELLVLCTAKISYPPTHLSESLDGIKLNKIKKLEPICAHLHAEYARAHALSFLIIMH